LWFCQVNRAFENWSPLTRAIVWGHAPAAKFDEVVTIVEIVDFVKILNIKKSVKKSIFYIKVFTGNGC
jgi:hypothetical protein